MKILIIQLARFGDIFQTWPALRALRRSCPEAQIDFLVRERFKGACEGLGSGINVIAFPTQNFLRSVIFDNDEQKAGEELSAWLQPLVDTAYDRIVNLSFSPSSSYLTSALSAPQTVVAGYTRHSDGHFHVPDDTSAYFYAQVGLDKGNRYHLTQIFSTVCGVDLTSGDWCYEGSLAPVTDAPDCDYLLAHLGASDFDKTYTPFKFTQALKRIEAEWSGQILLIGSANEKALGQQVVEGSGLTRTHNWIGRTTFAELFSLTKNARLLMGADSAPIHIASLVGVKVLNLSFGNVNFWETGPTSPGSQILVAETPEDLPSDQVARAALAILKGDEAENVWTRESYLGDYTSLRPQRPDFRWQLIQALYTGSAFPVCENQTVSTAFKRLLELSELALGEMAKSKNGFLPPSSLQILGHVDSLLTEIPTLVPEVQPVVDWFQTERVRIKPGPLGEVFQASEKAFHDFHSVLSVYVQELPLQEARDQGIAMCYSLAESLSEWDMKAASSQLNTFLELCRTMARISPKVGDSDLKWSYILSEVESGFQKKDYLRLVDLLQHEISPALQNWVS